MPFDSKCSFRHGSSSCLPGGWRPPIKIVYWSNAFAAPIWEKSIDASDARLDRMPKAARATWSEATRNPGRLLAWLLPDRWLDRIIRSRFRRARRLKRGARWPHETVIGLRAIVGQVSAQNRAGQQRDAHRGEAESPAFGRCRDVVLNSTAANDE